MMDFEPTSEIVTKKIGTNLKPCFFSFLNFNLFKV